MTCRERLRKTYPDMNNDTFNKIIGSSCPEDFSYLGAPKNCQPFTTVCEKCWDREVPETPTEEKTVNEQRAESGLPPIQEIPIIKDSGNRREFSSGAVRDMQEGKGRCDLMPLEVVAEYFRLSKYAPDPERAEDYYWILWNIANFKNSDYTITSYLYSAMAIFSARFYDCAPTMFLEVAKHFEEGAKKYGENNWQKGIPPKCYIDSAVRHFLKCYRGDNDEPHNNAFIWNLMCCIWEVDHRKKKDG